MEKGKFEKTVLAEKNGKKVIGYVHTNYGKIKVEIKE
jgi:hypothetical protein